MRRTKSKQKSAKGNKINIISIFRQPFNIINSFLWGKYIYINCKEPNKIE